MRNYYILLLVVLPILLNAQEGVFRLKKISNGNTWAQLSYAGYTPLTFGVCTNTSFDVGNWAIEHWNGGLNFWRPWPNSNRGNYKLFLKDSGGVGIGKIPSYDLDVNGNIALTGQIFITSDENSKINIKPISLNLLDRLQFLEIYTYNYKNFNNTNAYIQEGEQIDEYKEKTIEVDMLTVEDTVDRVGLLAQNVEEYFPEFVVTDENGNKSIDYISFIPVLLKSVQELQKEVEELKKVNHENN